MVHPLPTIPKRIHSLNETIVSPILNNDSLNRSKKNVTDYQALNYNGNVIWHFGVTLGLYLCYTIKKTFLYGH